MMMMMNQGAQIIQAVQSAGATCDSTFMAASYHDAFNGFNTTYNPVTSTGVFPALTDFAGDANFQIILNECDDSVKKKWLVSWHFSRLTVVQYRT